MPAEAMALVGLFIGLSIGAGIVAWLIIGPRAWWSFPLPIVAAFVALYLLGHNFAISIGPTIGVFGFDVALPFDIAVALVTAFIVAGGQRWLAGWPQRRPTIR